MKGGCGAVKKEVRIFRERAWRLTKKVIGSRFFGENEKAGGKNKRRLLGEQL